MNHQTPFLIALGMLTASALVVGVTGWILFARDHAARKLSLAGPDGGSTSVPDRTASHEHHHEVTEES